MSRIGHNNPPATRDYGWVAIARAMRNHPLVGFHLFAKPCDANRGAVQPALAFIDLIMECKYEDGKVVNGGREMIIHRGQLVGAVSWLAQRWNWTPMAVRTWLDKLEADGIIYRNVPSNNQNNKHHGKVATIITLCKYDEYQSGSVSEQHTQQQITQPSEQQTQQQHYKDNHTNHINNNTPKRAERSQAEKDEADRIAREAYERGLRVKGDASAKSARPEAKARGGLDGSQGLLLDGSGRLQFVNGVGQQIASELVADFPGVDLKAVCNRAAAEIVKTGWVDAFTAKVILRRHAQFVAEDAEKRPGSARQAKATGETPEQRRKRLIAEATEELRVRK